MIPSFAPFAMVTLLGMEFPAILDSSSDLLLIGDAVLVQCRTKRVNLKETSTCLQLASGTVLPAEAVIRLYMHFGGKTCRQHFTHVSGLTVPVILERDFVAHTKMVLELANKGFYLEPEDTFFPFLQPSPQEYPHPVNITTLCQFWDVKHAAPRVSLLPVLTVAATPPAQAPP